MAKKVSELDELVQLTGDEELYVSREGGDYKVKTKRLSTLVTKEGLGLDEVDNTPDAEKPVSQPVAEALSQKSDTGHVHQISQVQGLNDNLLALSQAINDKPSAMTVAQKVNTSDLPAAVATIVAGLEVVGDVSVGTLDW